MRVIIKLIFSLVAVIVLVAFGFAFWQARQEEIRLKTELERRANVIADSLRESVQPLLSSNSSSSLRRIVDKFSNRERLLGVSIHDIYGNLILASPDLEPKLKEEPNLISTHIQNVERLGSEYGAFIRLNKEQVHSYSMPIGVGEKTSYVLTLFHNTSYIRERVERIWENSFWRALIQAFLISLTTLLIVYLSVMTPIRKTTDWIRRVRRGEVAENFDRHNQVILGSLTNEISKMAKSLKMARLSAEEEARLRLSLDTAWTPERLKEWVRVKLQGRPLFVVSNREPYMHFKNGKNVECIVPASGMITAIEPVIGACGGTWIAHGAGDADQEMVDKNARLRVPPEEPRYTLRRVWLSSEEEQGYYYGFSNEGLWPLCHIAHTRPIFRSQDWENYKTVNQKFAEVVLEETQGTAEPYILIQDYQLALLPRLIKTKRPDARVGIFWHIPWPNPESFGICPWQKEILQGMLGADIIGFHTQFHCNNFVETVDRFLESRIDYEHFTINRENQITWIRSFPISIAFLGRSDFSYPVNVRSFNKENLLKSYGIKAEFIGVGVDRLDYTKGILERFRSVEYFLEAYPEYQGKFTFVELGAPSRTLIPKYQEFLSEVQKETERINSRFKTKNWQPILLLVKHHSHEEIAPFYRLADVCLVTSLHDGMNLVAKEFVMARDDEKGVLVLSQFTGAARELKEALIVNPYDVAQTAEAIKLALEMPLEEQQIRMSRMREVLKDRNIYRWAADLIGELSQVQLENRPDASLG